MEPNEISINIGPPDMSVTSASYQPQMMLPNFIRNVEEDDFSNDILSRAEPVLRTHTNHHTQVKRVMASDLRNFVKSKEDLYIIMSIEGQLHLPPYDECTMEFMRDALSGKKRLLTNRELASVNVPRYKEFNAQKLQKAAMGDAELLLYLPDALSDNKVINRKFLFNVSPLRL